MHSIHLRFELAQTQKKKINDKRGRKKKKFIHGRPKLQARCFLEVKYGGFERGALVESIWHP